MRNLMALSLFLATAAIAAAQAGWKEAYNVLEGFEGDKNAEGQRNAVGGWKFARLPWIQS